MCESVEYVWGICVKYAWKCVCKYVKYVWKYVWKYVKVCVKVYGSVCMFIVCKRTAWSSVILRVVREKLGKWLVDKTHIEQEVWRLFKSTIIVIIADYYWCLLVNIITIDPIMTIIGYCWLLLYITIIYYYYRLLIITNWVLIMTTIIGY